MIDINQLARPALAIVDAIVGMEGHGPSGGDPREIGALIAGGDITAVDAICCELVAIDPQSLPLMRAAGRVGYGTLELGQIELHGTPVQDLCVPDFKKPAHTHSVLDIIPLPKRMRVWVRRVLTARVEIDRELCIGCNACKKGCPLEPSAIDPEQPGTGVDQSTCIRCYCCHEFCPVKAIRLRRSWVDRIFRINALTEALARFGERCRSRRS